MYKDESFSVFFDWRMDQSGDVVAKIVLCFNAVGLWFVAVIWHLVNRYGEMVLQCVSKLTEPSKKGDRECVEVFDCALRARSILQSFVEFRESG